MQTRDVQCLATNPASNHRRRVWRRLIDADPAFNIALHRGPQPRVMVWDAISFDSRPPLYPGLTFQQDNSKPHTAHVVMNCLTAFQTLPLPATSPYLSPVEHVWDMMRQRLHVPGNFDDLTQQLEQIWQEIPQETIWVIYHSMPRPAAACIQARAGYGLPRPLDLMWKSGSALPSPRSPDLTPMGFFPMGKSQGIGVSRLSDYTTDKVACLQAACTLVDTALL
ncbi:transposable element Tc1 transposase [Trichonephila clavipes]|nr:transposable element Tc1 transposase [Trichonephila clavipes]